MPALEIFQKRFAFGTDDLALPASFGIVMRIMYIGSILWIRSFVDEWWLSRWSLLMVFIFATTIFTYLLIFKNSLQGSIVDVEKRRLSHLYLKLLAVLLILEFLANCAGTIIIATVAKETGWIWLLILNMCVWVHIVLLAACAIATSSGPAQDRHAALLEDARTIEQNRIESINRWEGRCRSWCRFFRLATCNLFGSGAIDAGDATYAQVAKVMAQYFTGMDLVPSDLIAALCLVRAEQRSREAACVQAIIRLSLNPTAEPDYRHLGDETRTSTGTGWLWAGTNEKITAQTMLLHVRHLEDSHLALDQDACELLYAANHYAPFMLGIYGKLLFTYMNLASGPFHLLCSEKGHEDDVGVVDGDDCCGFHNAAMRKQTAINSNTEMVYTSYTNSNHLVPYAIGVDHTTRTVMVVVRGTISAGDMLVDALVEPESLVADARKWGFEEYIQPTSCAHKGMLLCAARVREDIENKKILSTIMGRRNSSSYGSVEQDAFIDKLPHCEGYHLRLIGHSLGGGVASILSLFLKPQYPDLRVLAYSPPGCIFDYDLAESSADWIDSVFVGNDLVPHASWHSLIKLRGQMLEMLRRCKVNKTTAIRSAVSNSGASSLLYDPSDVPKTFARDELLRRIEMLHGQQIDDPLHAVEMYAPGRLLHIMRVSTHRDGCCKSKDKFLPAWVSDRAVLDEFLVSRRMALDHFPNYVAKVIGEVAEEFHTYSDTSLRIPVA